MVKIQITQCFLKCLKMSQNVTKISHPGFFCDFVVLGILGYKNGVDLVLIFAGLWV